jgi:hypothetical protein
MRLACFLFTLATVSVSAENLAVRTGVLLKASVVGHALIVDDIFLNGTGPYRMLIDTGDSSSIVRPEIARREKPTFDGALTSLLGANGGVVPAQNCTVRFKLAGARDRLMNAFRIDVNGLGPGLLPASAFASVFVSNREGFVEFSR